MKMGDGDTGFTLLELMIVVFIVAILAAVAMPRFSAHMFRGRQESAKAILEDARMSMEKYRGREGSYLAAGQPLSLLGIAVDADDRAVGAPYPYKFEITLPTNAGNRYTFNIRAVCDPSDRCRIDDDSGIDQMEIDQSGVLRRTFNDCL